MRILIIEDEKHNSQRLEQLIMEINQSAEIVSVLNSLYSFLKLIKNNYETNTIAYSEYALKSFELNSIAYIVKPYDKKELQKVFQKYNDVRSHFFIPETQLLQEILFQKKTNYKRRILIRIGEQYQILNTREIAFVVFEHGLSFAYTYQNERFPLDLSMNELAIQLDPKMFFRINRQSIVNSSSIKKISNWFNARLKLETEPREAVEFVVSREKVKEFKEWLND